MHVYRYIMGRTISFENQLSMYRYIERVYRPIDYMLMKIHIFLHVMTYLI